MTEIGNHSSISCSNISNMSPAIFCQPQIFLDKIFCQQRFGDFHKRPRIKPFHRHGILHKLSTSVKFWPKSFHENSVIFNIFGTTNSVISDIFGMTNCVILSFLGILDQDSVANHV